MSSSFYDSLESKYTRYDATKLDASSLESVQREIGESEESRVKCLTNLKIRLEELEDIHPCLDEDFILAFLRAAKFDCSKAFAKIRYFYKKQDQQMDMFQHCKLTVPKAQLNRYFKASPCRMENNSIIIISKYPTVTEMSFDERFYLELLFFTHFLKNPITQMCGFTVLLDMNGYKFQTFLKHSSPIKLQFFINTFQNVYPGRIKSIHVFNQPQLFSALYTMACPLLTKKLKSRFFVHPNNDGWKSLHSSIPPEILPEEYGGQLKDSSLIDLLDDIEEKEKDFRKQLKFGSVKNRQIREAWNIFKLE